MTSTVATPGATRPGLRLLRRLPLLALLLAAAALTLLRAGAPARAGRGGGACAAMQDIRADWDNRAEFRGVLPLRQAEEANPVAYEGAKVSDQQRHAYPDIAALMLEAPPADTFRRALTTAEQLGWTIV